MNLSYDEALTIKRELKVCARVLNSPEKYSKQTIAMFRKAKDSAEKKHGIYSHPKPFEETCEAYGQIIEFPVNPTHRVDV